MKSPRPSSSSQAPAHSARPTSPSNGDERSAVLIARYEQLIFSEPGEDVPLTRLAELVRQRDGNLKQLLERLEQKAAEAQDKYAALIAWGGILAKDDQKTAAMDRLLEATRLRPERPEAWLLLGTIQRALGKTNDALASYEKALAHTSGPARSLLIRDARDLSLDVGDFDNAKKHHQTLTQESKGNLFLQGELGRELLRRGQTERAITELSEVVKNAHGDSRALAPALRDLGEAQIEAGKTSEAIESLKRASKLAVASPGLRVAIDTLRAQAHRKEGSLGEFLDDLAATAADAPRLGLLGRLYEEEGHTDRAISTYKKALARAGQDIDLRLRLVRLYEVTGDIEGAVSEYSKLVKSAPRDVGLALRYAEMLLAQGERERAVQELDRIDRVAGSDPEVGLLLLDFADRLEETERSRKILARLSQAATRDPRFLVELGSRYYQNGETEAARKTWKKILTVHKSPADAHLIYGEVLLDHEAADEGVAELAKAHELAPNDLKVKKSLALGLERAASQSGPASRRTHENGALKIWTSVLTQTAQDTSSDAVQAANLARRHIVRLWKRTGQLSASLVPLEAKLSSSPPDLEAGRLLAEGYLAAQRDRRAVTVLETILKHAPGDRGSLLLLEAAHTRSGDFEAAIEVLGKLVKADPRRAREYYDRMSRAAALRNDRSGALRFAELAVEKNPTDPAAQAALGDLYLAQGETEKAEAAYRRALAQDDRLHTVNLKLADLLAKTARAPEALDALFHVARSSRQPEAIGIAARRAINLSVALHQERRVEDVLRPLAIGHPEQPLYRTLLLEVLSAQMYPLQLASRHEKGSARIAAQHELAALSDRSTGLLLAALSGTNAGEQQVAISLLAHGTTSGAASGLLAFAEGSAKEDQRLLAVLALGRLHGAAPTDRLSAMVITDGTAARGRLARAAAWVLSRKTDPLVVPTLLEGLKSGDPELRAYAALGLGDLHQPGDRERSESRAALAKVVGAPETGAVARAAAILALGRLADPGDTAVAETLHTVLDDRSSLVKRAALLSLCRLSHDEPTQKQIARGLLSEDEGVRDGSAYAATLLAQKGADHESTSLLPDELSPADLDARARVDKALTVDLSDTDPRDRHAALVLLEEDLITLARIGLRSSAASAQTILQQMFTSEEGALMGRLLVHTDYTAAPPSPLLAQAQAAAERIRESLKEEILALASGPHPELTREALRRLSAQDGPEARRILAHQLRSTSPEINQAALFGLANAPNAAALEILQPYLRDEQSWGRRRRATQVVGTILREAPEERTRAAAEELLKKLELDVSALVRQAASAELER